MTAQEKQDYDSRLLAAFVRSLKHYKAVWGLTADKMIFLNAWRDAKRTVRN